MSLHKSSDCTCRKSRHGIIFGQFLARYPLLKKAQTRNSALPLHHKEREEHGVAPLLSLEAFKQVSPKNQPRWSLRVLKKE